MDLWLVTRHAWELMDKHGLQEWTFTFDRAKCRYGACNHNRRQISLSRHYVELEETMQDIENTILHEIAHALTPGHHHNAIWRAKAEEIGGSGERCGRGTLPAWRGRRESVIVACCKNCGRVYRRCRRPRRHVSCGACANRYVDAYRLEWKQLEDRARGGGNHERAP